MIEILVALNVIDNELYDCYREEMTPILKRAIRVDFHMTLKLHLF